MRRDCEPTRTSEKVRFSFPVGGPEDGARNSDAGLRRGAGKEKLPAEIDVCAQYEFEQLPSCRICDVPTPGLSTHSSVTMELTACVPMTEK